MFSVAPAYKNVKLSIPYWDFLVLNLLRDFVTTPKGIFAFNSLLGFSSFESQTFLTKNSSFYLTFQFPIGIF